VSLAKKIAVEPLSEARWERVERALLRQLEQLEQEDPSGTLSSRGTEGWRSLRWRPAAALVMTGAAAAAVGVVGWHLFSRPAEGIATTRLETGAYGSQVEVGESTVDVGPESTVRVSGDDGHGVVLVLNRGRVECDVPPRRARPAFVVEAGAVTVRVIGTHFAVRRVEDATTVDVQRGVVDVEIGEEHVLVHAGEHWPPSPRAVALPSGSAGETPSDAAAATSLAAASTSRLPAGTTAREQYEAASRLESAQPEVAIAMYGGLARRGGPWGMNALFAEGRLQAERGHDDEARALLRDYLARFPSGPNADDARRVIGRLH
jgi:hypothetical protein